MLYDIEFTRIDDEHLLIKYVFSRNMPFHAMHKHLEKVEESTLYNMLSEKYKVAYQGVQREQVAPKVVTEDVFLVDDVDPAEIIAAIKERQNEKTKESDINKMFKDLMTDEMFGDMFENIKGKDRP